MEKADDKVAQPNQEDSSNDGSKDDRSGENEIQLSTLKWQNKLSTDGNPDVWSDIIKLKL